MGDIMKTRADSRRPEHLSAVRQALWKMPRVTRAQLSESTGLSAMTVGKLLAVMQERGEVRQDETQRGAGGRPSMIAQYNADYAHFAVIVVEQENGKSEFTLSVHNLLGEAAYEEKLRGAKTEADSVIKSAVNVANEREKEIIAEAKIKADGIVRQAENDAVLERRKAEDGIRKEIVEVSSLLTEKMLEREVSQADHQRFIDSFIESIGEDDAD